MSGKIDALLFVIGIPLGSLIFTVSYDSMANFHTKGAMGRKILSELLGLPSGVMVFLVALFAIGALFAVTKIEAIVNEKWS